MTWLLSVDIRAADADRRPNEVWPAIWESTNSQASIEQYWLVIDRPATGKSNYGSDTASEANLKGHYFKVALMATWAFHFRAEWFFGSGTGRGVPS